MAGISEGDSSRLVTTGSGEIEMEVAGVVSQAPSGEMWGVPCSRGALLADHRSSLPEVPIPTQP
jgi:hypothetical protein